MPHRTVLTATAIRAAITAAVERHAARPEGHPLTITAISADLSYSRSTVQRALASAGTTFTEEMRKARALAAARALSKGATVAQASARVGVTSDHLRVVLLKEYGIAPGALRRCLHISRILNRC